jgi:hypothetical protein
MGVECNGLFVFSCSFFYIPPSYTIDAVPWKKMILITSNHALLGMKRLLLLGMARHASALKQTVVWISPGIYILRSYTLSNLSLFAFLSKFHAVRTTI